LGGCLLKRATRERDLGKLGGEVWDVRWTKVEIAEEHDIWVKKKGKVVEGGREGGTFYLQTKVVEKARGDVGNNQINKRGSGFLWTGERHLSQTSSKLL
jgi:hypothetical protein